MLMLTVKKEDIKDYLDWLKVLVTIASTAVAALAFKYEGLPTRPFEIKVATSSFVVALVFLALAFTGLIEHKNSRYEKLHLLASSFLVIGLFAFLLAFGFLGIKVS
jgi:hypothetical protein